MANCKQNVICEIHTKEYIHLYKNIYSLAQTKTSLVRILILWLLCMYCAELHAYYSTSATLPVPQVAVVGWNTSYYSRILQLNLTKLEGYNSGKFILRYDCGLREIPIELEYRSIEISSGSSDVVVIRSRSCFVVGEISRVTVWFVSGRHISSIPAVVNATSGEGETGGAARARAQYIILFSLRVN